MTSPGIVARDDARLLPSPSLSPASDYFAWRDQQLLLERQSRPSDVKRSDTAVTSISHPTAGSDVFNGQTVQSATDGSCGKDESSPREVSRDLQFRRSSNLVVDIADKSADDDEQFLSAASSPSSLPPDSRSFAGAEQQMLLRQTSSTSLTQQTFDDHNWTGDALQTRLSDSKKTKEICRDERVDIDNAVSGSLTESVTSPFRCDSAASSSSVDKTRNADCERSDSFRPSSSNWTVVDVLPDLVPMELFARLRNRKDAAAAEGEKCIAIDAAVASNGDDNAEAEAGPLSASTPLEADVAVFSADRSRTLVAAATNDVADKSDPDVIDHFYRRNSPRSTDFDDNVTVNEGATVDNGILSAESLSKEIAESKMSQHHLTDCVGSELTGVAIADLSPPPPFDSATPLTNGDVKRDRSEMTSQSDGQMTSGGDSRGNKLGNHDGPYNGGTLSPRKSIIFGHIPPPKYLFENRQYLFPSQSSSHIQKGAVQTRGDDDRGENVEQNSRQRTLPSSELSHFKIFDIDIDGSSAPETAATSSPKTQRPLADRRDAEVHLSALKKRVNDAKPIAPASSIDEDKWNAMVTGKLSQYRLRSSMPSLQFTNSSWHAADGRQSDVGGRCTDDGLRRARSVHSLLPELSSVRPSSVHAADVSPTSDEGRAIDDDTWLRASLSADVGRVLGRRGRDADDDERSKSLTDLRTERDLRLYDMPSIDNVGELVKSPFATTADIAAAAAIKRNSSTADDRQGTSKTDLWMRQSLERLDLPTWCRDSPRLNQEIVILKHAKSSDLTTVRCGSGSDGNGAERLRRSSDRAGAAASRPAATFCNVRMLPSSDGGRRMRDTAASAASEFRLPSEKLRMKLATPTYSQIKTESFEDLMKSLGISGSKSVPVSAPRCETAKEMYLRLKKNSSVAGARISEIKSNSGLNRPSVVLRPQ
jgi:hypothetical protein